jgi:3-oxoadipate enol-lactonase
VPEPEPQPTTGPDLTFTRLAGDDDLPLLVVGPSLGTSVEALWSAAAERLGDTHRVVGWDLPGHGRSPRAAGPFTVADLAAVVRATAAGLAESAAYAGVSIGGAVALQLALDPGPFTMTASIASAAQLGAVDGWHERAALVRRAGTSVMVDGSVQRWFAPGFVERDPATANRLLLSLSDADDDSYARCCEALAGFDLRSRLGEARVPVLVLPGEVDPVVSVDVARSVADALPRASYAVAVGCAHLPPAEDPAGVADLLSTRLAESSHD